MKRRQFLRDGPPAILGLAAPLTTNIGLKGKEGLIAHLFAFNLGIEFAQLLVVAAVLFASFLMVQLLKISGLWWIRVASLTILAFSLYMAFQRFPYKTTINNEKTVFMPVGNDLYLQHGYSTKSPEQSWI